jgi:hypothetical protein
MSAPLSLSIFTIEADSEPILTFSAKKQQDAELFSNDQKLREKLRSARLGGRALCDDLTIFRVRLANAAERTRYRAQAMAETTGESRIVFLVDMDGG